MRTAELYKLRTHRTPVVCAAVLLIGTLIPSGVLMWYKPTNDAAYTEAYLSTFELLSMLIAVVFGGWLLGTEYRQGTVKRLLASEPRRLRALATKGAVGISAMAAVTFIVGTVGWAVARVVGSANDVTVVWEGRSLLAFSVSTIVVATFAYGLSAITRSDSFAMVGTLAMVFMFEPLLSLVPKVGNYTVGTSVGAIEEWISDVPAESIETVSLGTGMVTLAAWLFVFVGGGATLFARRDV